MAHSKENEVFSIQTFDLTKRFTKKKHKGIFSFLRRERKKENQKSEQSETTVALDHVNIKIRSGELFGLLGPNGAGKTTLVKCLSTILIPDKGSAVARAAIGWNWGHCYLYFHWVHDNGFHRNSGLGNGLQHSKRAVVWNLRVNLRDAHQPLELGSRHGFT